jgi:TrmH family RNA methyltransferase
MAAPLAITSAKNPRVKDVVALKTKARERDARGVLVVEGAREIDRALRSGFRAESVFACPDELSPAAQAILASLGDRGQRFEVTREVFAKLAVREGSDGLVVVFAQRRTTLAELRLPAVPLLLAVESVEKPGNLGALLRSADGAGADAVIVLGHGVDLYNPNVIRTSLGTIFHVPVVAATSAEFSAFCAERGLAVHAAALTERTQDYAAVDYAKPCVILLGSEKAGLSPAWLEGADTLVKIPMLGIADSLNVATAGTVLLYEARRQRGQASAK